MRTVNIHEAKTQLSRLIAEVEAGEDIVLARGGKPVARLVRVDDARPARRFGAMRGRARVDDAFFEPLPVRARPLGVSLAPLLLDGHALLWWLEGTLGYPVRFEPPWRIRRKPRSSAPPRHGRSRRSIASEGCPASADVAREVRECVAGQGSRSSRSRFRMPSEPAGSRDRIATRSTGC